MDSDSVANFTGTVREKEMNIGEAARSTGLPIKTIRYYENIGLVRVDRSANGYRTFDDNAVRKLNFVGRARSLGFSVENCRVLLSLYDDKARESAEVRAIAKNHLSQVEEKIRELNGLREALVYLIDNCAGDSRPDCPIIDDLAGEMPTQTRAN